jgi:hypothetical protein
MPENCESSIQESYNPGQQQRYFKLTPKAHAPEVTKEWPAKKMPWYYQHALQWILILIAIPIALARKHVPDDSWIEFVLEMVLVWIAIMVILPPREVYY